MNPSTYFIDECERVPTPFGNATRLLLYRCDMQPMYWEEIQAVLRKEYPDQWGIQSFPFKEREFNGAHKYHVFLLEPGIHPACFDLLTGEL